MKNNIKTIKDFVSCNWYLDSIKRVKRTRVAGIILLIFVSVLFLWIERNGNNYITIIFAILLSWTCIIIGILSEKRVRKILSKDLSETEFLISRITHELNILISLAFAFLTLVFFKFGVSLFLVSTGIIASLLATSFLVAIYALKKWTVQNNTNPTISKSGCEIISIYMRLMQDGGTRAVGIIVLMSISSYIDIFILIMLLSVIIGMCFPYYFIIVLQLILAKNTI
ncbi:MAG: hypothetical protein IKE52_03390 [Mogibacterium sp.]|nr:hypothetical protein [Mogibacterium sp.]